jgi:hypothetical protein
MLFGISSLLVVVLVVAALVVCARDALNQIDRRNRNYRNRIR